MAKGRVDEALDQYRTAIGLMPKMPRLYFNHASALVSLGRLEEAEKVLRTLVERFPAAAQGWNNLGFVQFQRGDPATAIVSLRRGEKLDPKAADIKTNLRAALRAEAERLARDRKFGPAEGMYRELLQTAPDDVQLLTNHGVTLFELGRREEAIAAFRRAIAIDPDATEANESLAIAIGRPLPPPPPQEQAPFPSTLAPPPGLR